MLRKTLLCIAILFGILQFQNGQGWRSWIAGVDHLKYWHYRQRLISDFLVMGVEDPISCELIRDPDNYKYGGCGLSIPSVRYESLIQDNHYNWGDASADLGWYIGILATELRLLDNYSQNWASTQYELYCALKAYERIDATAAAIGYPYTSTTRCNDVNGTFIRDDVDANLVEKYKAFSAKLGSWDSDLKSSNNNLQNANSYMSQDQIASLFMGFALVKKCLENDGSTRYYKGIDLVGLARNYTTQIATHMRDNGYIGTLDDGKPYPNNRGLYDEGDGYPFARAVDFITGDNSFAAEFDDMYIIPRTIWQNKDIIFDYSTKDYSVALTLCFAAIGNVAWGGTSRLLQYK